MRLIIIAVLAVLIVLTLLMPLLKKKKPSLFTAAILLIPAVALGYFEYTWTENQEKLETAFKVVTEVPSAKLSCERMSVEWFDAFISINTASSGRGSVSMKHSTCAPLLAYQNLEDKNTADINNGFTLAILAFTEASVSMKNPNYDSQKVRCSAVKQIPKTVGAFGGSEKQAYLIQQYYKNNIQNSKLTTQVC